MIEFVRNSYRPSYIYKSFHCIFFSMEISTFKIIVDYVYINPKQSPTSFTNLMSAIEFITTNFVNTPIIITGDFNSRVDIMNQLPSTFYLPPNLSLTRATLDTKLKPLGKRLCRNYRKRTFYLVKRTHRRGVSRRIHLLWWLGHKYY